MTELRPCPFCGGDAKIVDENKQVQCTKCLACMDSRSDTFGAIVSWNNRPAKQIAKLVVKIDTEPMQTILRFVDHYISTHSCECLEGCVCGYEEVRQAMEKLSDDQPKPKTPRTIIKRALEEINNEFGLRLERIDIGWLTTRTPSGAEQDLVAGVKIDGSLE